MVADLDISFWTVVWYIIAGLIIGLLARAILPGRQEMGILMTIALGIVGSIIGGILWNLIFKDQQGVSWIGGIIVAVILLWAYNRFAARQRTAPPAGS